MIMKKTIPFLLLFLLFAGAAWYSLTRQPEPIDELPPPQAVPALPATQQQPPVKVDDGEVEEVFEPEPVTQPEPLPALSESDPEVTKELAGIVGDGPLMEYLVTDQVLSRVVASIDSLTSRQVPVHINPVKPVSDKFIVDSDGENLVMSEQNFERYDGYVSLMAEMDTDSMITFYRRYYPLFQQAWEQNGGTGSFNNRLFEVIDDLMETPDVTGPVFLVKPEAVYLYEDPELEALTAGQKVLIRMGSENAAVVKQKLKELKSEFNPQGG
jgi:hypothetical protein